MDRRGVFLLFAAALAAAHASAVQAACRSYVSNGLIQTAVGTLQDVLVVQDAFEVQDLAVTLDVSHRRVGALKITLGVAPFSNAAGPSAPHPSIVLKSHGLGRRGQNLYHTTFSDSAAAAFPLNMTQAPFTGSFRPVQKLAFLAEGQGQVGGSGGAQGMWTLTVADVAPNNTLREIALDGWTLTLCDGALPPTPAPAPAPPVVGYDGPSEPGSPSAGSSGGGSGGVYPSNILGWQVVYKNQPPRPGAPPVSPSPPGAAGDSLQQLMAQRPLLTLLQQQIGAIASGVGGACDPTCQEAKKSMWRAAVFGLYMHSLAERHGVQHLHLADLVQRLRDWLPGENSRLGQLQDWLQEHSEDLHSLGAWLRDHLRLPTLTVDGQPLDLPQLGSGEALQALLSGGGDKVQALLAAFGAAGQHVAALASSLAGHVGGNAASLAEFYSQAGQNVAARLAAARERRQDALGGLAGSFDAKGEAFHSLMSGLEGSNLQELAQALAGAFQL